MPKETLHALTNSKIIVIKGLHNLTCRDIGKITGNSGGSVANWIMNPNSKGYRVAPTKAVKKLTKLYCCNI